MNDYVKSFLLAESHLKKQKQQKEMVSKLVKDFHQRRVIKKLKSKKSIANNKFIE